VELIFSANLSFSGPMVCKTVNFFDTHGLLRVAHEGDDFTLGQPKLISPACWYIFPRVVKFLNLWQFYVFV
jgi:hypothetical protein